MSSASANPNMITAWGETKHITDWVEDPRCTVSDTKTLLRRINVKGMAPEEAITTSVGKGPRVKREVTAWGETKHIREWAEDPRCCVTRGTMISRMDLGWDGEDIVSLPVGCTPSTAVRAFGEVLSVQQWARHPKCAGIGAEALRHRIDGGMDPETAITTPPGHKNGTGLITAWGETKLLHEWEQDPRCSGVVGRTMIERVKAGWSPEDAISKPPAGGSRLSLDERFERYLRAPYKARTILIDLFQEAAKNTGESVQFSNRYAYDDVKFCFGVWVDAADGMKFGYELGQLAASEQYGSQRKALEAMLPKAKPTVSGGGTLYLFEGWRAVTASGQVWRDE